MRAFSSYRLHARASNIISLCVAPLDGLGKLCQISIKILGQIIRKVTHNYNIPCLALEMTAAVIPKSFCIFHYVQSASLRWEVLQLSRVT
jgi:hypothetical protein